jgi:hypothetical protein
VHAHGRARREHLLADYMPIKRSARAAAILFGKYDSDQPTLATSPRERRVVVHPTVRTRHESARGALLFEKLSGLLT